MNTSSIKEFNHDDNKNELDLINISQILADFFNGNVIYFDEEYKA